MRGIRPIPKLMLVPMGFLYSVTRCAADYSTLSGGLRSSLVAATVSDAIEYYRRLAEAGLRYFIASVWGADVETLRLLAVRVIPEVHPPHRWVATDVG